MTSQNQIVDIWNWNYRYLIQLQMSVIHIDISNWIEDNCGDKPHTNEWQKWCHLS